MKPMIRVVIIDDDKPSVDVLAGALRSFPQVEVVAVACNSAGGEAAILTHKPQLLFLDIELPSINGMDFFAGIRKKVSWEMRVVFYTSYDKYLLQALRMQAFDFLLKPVDRKELERLIERYGQEAKPLLAPVAGSGEKLLLITTIISDKMVLRSCNVGYFRYNSGRKVWEVILDDGRCIVLKHNTTAEIILAYGPEFVQIHKTFIINLKYLNLIQGNLCLMLPPFEHVKELKISKLYRKKLLECFYDL